MLKKLDYVKATEKHGIPHHINRAGSMIGIFFTDEPVINYDAAKSSSGAYYREMVEQGVFLPPSQFEGLFLSTAHGTDIEATIAG